ncbi:MAG: VOC family protein [Nitrospira sp.]|nr:VOC family protein [Candidatus Manganitrophaceae bacterium]HIL34830.1 VOC family protein [Candidatus Manganitrophaceae bacterium]
MAKIITDSWVKADVGDMEMALAFYAKLGLKPTMQVPSYSELTFPGGTVLGLHQVKKDDPTGQKEKGSKNGFVLMLRVQNLDQVVRDLKNEGLEISKIAHAPGGADFSSIYDPDGNRLVLVEMGEAS